ncbi:MAG: hypothetical protein LC667_18165 [Thioalkalivibrio sp.]|nr:hypothetical protein [Thioalkalivibrio sp.]
MGRRMPPGRRVHEGAAKAEKGDANAQFRLAEMLGPTQPEERERLYRMAAEQGHVEAEFIMGMINFKFPTHREAAKWFQRAAEKAHGRRRPHPQ